MTGPGHVFVVHGRLENLACDAVLVPTDRDLNGLGGWRGVTGPDPSTPPGWTTSTARWAAGEERVWYLEVGRRSAADDLTWLEDGVRGALDAMAAIRPRRSDRRSWVEPRVRTLLAMPVVGIGRGGFGAERGEALRRVHAAARAVAEEREVDVALVTDDAAVHGALQHVRRQEARTEDLWHLPDALRDAAMHLATTARSGGLALFLGAGVSVPAGLPTWAKLLEHLGGGTEAGEGFARLGPLDQAQLLRHRRGKSFDLEVADLCRTSRHAIGHALLAALECTEVVTTNFDDCYERAHDAVGRRRGRLEAVIPRSVPAGRAPWLLKMHGDVAHPASMVLSRKDFVRYDAASRPAAAVLQSLLLTRHLLVVGASLTDDNVLRLAHEVSDFRRDNGIEGTYGTVLDVDDAFERSDLWTGELTWLRMPGTDVATRARTVEVFLDALSASASTDSSWLLDRRFSALLSPAEQRLADAARRLRTELGSVREGTQGPWADVAAHLDERGASSAP